MSIDINGKLSGHVKWYNDDKGFGLIEHESGATYAVRHVDVLTIDKIVYEGDYVSFFGEVIDGTLTATNITLL